MGLEAVTYPNDLVVTNPIAGDPRSEGDDHIRNIKTAVVNAFPGLAGRAWRVQAKALAYTVLATDNMSVLDVTAGAGIAFTAAATLGNGHQVFVYADAADVILDPNGVELINGAATLTVPAGFMAWVLCTGTAFNCWLSPVSLTKGAILRGGAANVPGAKLVGSNGQLLVADSTQTDGLIWTDYTRPTVNINPNWLFDQINEGALYTVNTTGVNGPDGWSGDAVGAGVFKLRTIADPDNASLRCLEISCTTADAAIGATDRYEVYTAIEGYDVAGLKIGTASAGYVTILVGIKSNSVTGLLGLFLTNGAGDRFYATTAITLAGTSETLFAIPVLLDTTGTWLYTNSIGLKLGLVLAAGSNFQGTAAAWTGSTVHTTSAQANFMSANTNIVYVKRIHVIPGNVGLAYSSQDLQRELAKVQRYYNKSYTLGVAVAAATAGGCLQPFVTSLADQYQVSGSRFPVTMRAAPTGTIYNLQGSSGRVSDGNQTDYSAGGVMQTIGSTGFLLQNNSGGTWTPGGNSISFHYAATTRLS